MTHKFSSAYCVYCNLLKPKFIFVYVPTKSLLLHIFNSRCLAYLVFFTRACVKIIFNPGWMLGITKAQKIIKFYQITKESTPTVKNHTWNSDQYKKLDFQLGNTVFLVCYWEHLCFGVFTFRYIINNFVQHFCYISPIQKKALTDHHIQGLTPPYRVIFVFRGNRRKSIHLKLVRFQGKFGNDLSIHYIPLTFFYTLWKHKRLIVFWCFQRVYNENNMMNWVKEGLRTCDEDVSLFRSDVEQPSEVVLRKKVFLKIL